MVILNRIPPSTVADRDLGGTIVIRMDASLVIAHSDKELAAGTHKAPGVTIGRSPAASATSRRRRPGRGPRPVVWPAAAGYQDWQPQDARRTKVGGKIRLRVWPPPPTSASTAARAMSSIGWAAVVSGG